jgi:hypothetical protein
MLCVTSALTSAPKKSAESAAVATARILLGAAGFFLGFTAFVFDGRAFFALTIVPTPLDPAPYARFRRKNVTPVSGF